MMSRPKKVGAKNIHMDIYKQVLLGQTFEILIRLQNSLSLTINVECSGGFLCIVHTVRVHSRVRFGAMGRQKVRPWDAYSNSTFLKAIAAFRDGPLRKVIPVRKVTT